MAAINTTSPYYLPQYNMQGGYRNNGKQQGRRINNKIQSTCTHCGNTGHTEDICYRKHGFPPGYGNKNKSGNRQHQYRVNYAATQALEKAELSSGNEESQYAPQGKGKQYTLTKDQYQRLISMLPQEQSSRASSPSNHSASSSVRGHASINTFNRNDNSGIILSTLLNKPANTLWIIDTGATDHIIIDKGYYSSYTTIEGHSVRLPNGNIVSASYIGSVEMSPKLVLHNVLCIPSFECNLISTSALLAVNKICMIVTESLCMLQEITSWERIGLAKEYRGLYLLEEPLPKLQNKSIAMSLSSSSSIWHQRLGHSSYKRMSRLNLPCNVSIPMNENACDICQKAKQKRQPFALSNSIAKGTFDLIHVDIWGPVKESFSGKHYFLTILDDHSRYTWVAMMGTKRETGPLLQQFCKHVSTQFEKQVKVIRSDNGPEFTMKDFYAQHGILHQITCPETPQQNGRVERKHQDIMNTTRAIMLQSSMPKALWAEAVVHAVYLINRLPSVSIQNDTPFERLYGYEPDLRNLRVFGCLAYASTLDRNKDKFTDRSVKCIFLGYKHGVKGYKLLNLTTNVMFFSRHVKIFEESFPYAESTNASDEQFCSNKKLDALHDTLPDDEEEDGNEGVLPECFMKPEEKEVRQLEVAPAKLKSSTHESTSDGILNPGVLHHNHESALTYQAGSSSYIRDVTAVTSSELSNQELESKYAYSSHSDALEDAVSSPSCCLPGTETSMEQKVELQTDKSFAESALVALDEVNSESLKLQYSHSCQSDDSGTPVELLELQSDEHDLVDGASSKSLDFPSNKAQIVSNMGQERCVDASYKPEALPSHEDLVSSVGQELSDTGLSRNPFDSVLPSSGLLPENSGEMPPLPPLPPMQWRIGKFQPPSLASQGQWTNLGKGAFLPMQPFGTDEKYRSDFLLEGGEIAHPSNPFLSITSDIQKPQHLSVESQDNSIQPTPLSSGLPTSVTDGSQQVFLPLEGMQSSDPSLNIPIATSEREEDGYVAAGGDALKSSGDTSSTVAIVADEPTDTVPLNGSQTKLLNQVIPESTSEPKEPENSSHSLAVDEQNHLEKSELPPTTLEDQHHQDVATLHGETTWLPSAQVPPPTYEVGKPNGSKLPRPRNPLIDAVAAHDKSKLRKVTERVHPQVGPKAEERDSLLEQIRTKSFNLKPTAVTRPSIQGIQGPKTNLKVAAILEKANAIRQALTGSDEDEDTDSWSDS